MKKITFILTFLMASYGFAQNVSTGVVTLTPGFSVQFDVNGTTDKVTMTMVGPSDVWLGVALNTSSGNSMGNGGEDVILFDSTGLKDRNFTGGTNAPNVDTSQDWTESSNTVTSGLRTIVATRALDTTGDSKDYVFPTTSGTSLPMLWAKGNEYPYFRALTLLEVEQLLHWGLPQLHSQNLMCIQTQQLKN